MSGSDLYRCHRCQALAQKDKGSSGPASTMTRLEDVARAVENKWYSIAFRLLTTDRNGNLCALNKYRCIQTPRAGIPATSPLSANFPKVTKQFSTRFPVVRAFGGTCNSYLHANMASLSNNTCDEFLHASAGFLKLNLRSSSIARPTSRLILVLRTPVRLQGLPHWQPHFPSICSRMWGCGLCFIVNVNDDHCLTDQWRRG